MASNNHFGYVNNVFSIFRQQTSLRFWILLLIIWPSVKSFKVGTNALEIEKLDYPEKLIELSVDRLSAKYYDPNANPAREDTDNPADTPRDVFRHVSGSPIPQATDAEFLNQEDYADMRGAPLTLIPNIQKG